MSFYSESADGITVRVRVIPRASKNEIAGLYGEALKVRLQAPPLDGRANKDLRRFLAKQFDIPPGSVNILSGEKGRSKNVLLRGCNANEFAAAVKKLKLTDLQQ